MRLSKITLQHYRSYEHATFEFSPKTTVIIGPNTAGKTNILEAVMTLSSGKSFRAKEERDVIFWGAEFARVGGSGLDSENEKQKLEVLITNGLVNGVRTQTKRFQVNGLGKRYADYVGLLPAVLFWPEDLELVTDSPSLRRNYLNHILSQTDREYRRTLISYERGLRQRNRLLDQISEGEAHRNQLLFWDQLLIKAGGYITEARMNLISEINAVPTDTTPYTITYDKSVISEARLTQYADAEIGAKVTLVGPHRDDFLIGKPSPKKDDELLDLSRYGSRGEQRMAVLWMKMAELMIIEKHTGTRPILLLDDILSELDEPHRDIVRNIVAKQQTIMTSAEEDIMEHVEKDSYVIRL